MPSPLEKICLNCPLLFCDTENVFCCFKWATDPNDAQKKLLSERTERAVLDRRAYRREHYDRNKAQILAYQKQWRKEKQNAVT